MGIAEGEGLLSLDEPLLEAFPKEAPENPCPNLRKATVRDLLTMCLGQGQGFLMGAQRPFLPERDWVRYSLALPFPYAPGEKFVYNNVGPYLAGILVQRRAGCDLVSYLTPVSYTHLDVYKRQPPGGKAVRSSWKDFKSPLEIRKNWLVSYSQNDREWIL